MLEVHMYVETNEQKNLNSFLLCNGYKIIVGTCPVGSQI